VQDATDLSNAYPITTDPGVTVPVTVAPDTVTLTASPSVVSPGGSAPKLSLIEKNANGTIVNGPGADGPLSDCSIDGFSWDNSNPNVTLQGDSGKGRRR
jgi:hypothetical protein